MMSFNDCWQLDLEVQNARRLPRTPESVLHATEDLGMDVCCTDGQIDETTWQIADQLQKEAMRTYQLLLHKEDSIGTVIKGSGCPATGSRASLWTLAGKQAICQSSTSSRGSAERLKA